MSDARKLATILAADIAGYSRASERDDANAAASVRAFRQVLTKVASDHGGRIFSSAGDGFMAELPTATAGLQAAIALLQTFKESAQPAPVLRIGIHLGEVIAEPDGDLLGHGVNIAARLQQMAPRGGVFVSEDVRRSVSGELAQSLKLRGETTLNKMQERMSVFAYTGAQIGPPLWLRSLPTRVGMAAVALVTALGAGALLFSTPTSTRTAVFAFSATEPVAQRLAVQTADLITVTMNELGLETIAQSETAQGSSVERGRAVNAAFVIDGAIHRESDVVRATVRLEDVRARQTIWSQTYERPDDDADALRPQIAAEVVNVLQCAAEARAERLRLQPNMMTVLLRTCELSAESGRNIELLTSAQELAASMPRSGFIQGRLALITARVGDDMPDQMREQHRLEALTAAERALRADRRNRTAAAVKAWALTPTQSRAESERTVRQLLEDAPDSPDLNGLYARLLRDSGRNQEAAVYYERAAARDPLSPYRHGNLAWALAIVGRNDEAQTLLDRAFLNWPRSDDLAWARLRTTFWFGTLEQTRQLLDDPANNYTADQRACWRRAIDGMSSASRRRAAAQAVETCLEPQFALQVLGSLGETDRAFDLVQRLEREEGHRLFAGLFFVPATADMRRDARFMPLMQRLGMIDLWRDIGRWPDFCEEPDLPYDCRAEAERLIQVGDRPQ